MLFPQESVERDIRRTRRNDIWGDEPVADRGNVLDSSELPEFFRAEQACRSILHRNNRVEPLFLDSAPGCAHGSRILLQHKRL